MNSKPSKIRVVLGIVALSLAFVVASATGGSAAPVQAGNNKKKPETLKSAPFPSQTSEIKSGGEGSTYMKLVSISLDEPFYYNPKGRIDPFKPFLLKMLARGKKGRKMLPLTPLQKLSFVELQRGLVAIVWGHLGNRALIQDPAGKGYIIKPGTPVGPGGVVKQILSDRVIIEQTVIDPATNKKIRKEITLTLKRGEKGEI